MSGHGINDEAHSVEARMVEIRERLALLESSLSSRIDAMEPPASQLPFKVLVYREALAWRMTELSRGAFENLGNGNLALGILETRAANETSAALWYLYIKIYSTVQAGNLHDIDDYLMKLIFGNKSDPDRNLPQAINVMTFVDCVEKEVQGFRRNYEILSEFAHPNWAGTALLYSNPDLSNDRTLFGRNVRDPAPSKRIGIRGVNIALRTFQDSYKSITEIMPAFLKLCIDSVEP